MSETRTAAEIDALFLTGKDYALSLKVPSEDQYKDMTFMLGYQAGMRQKLEEGGVSQNTARNLLGYPPYGAENVPAYPAGDPVKIVEHYSPGKSEVANFIADQELDFNRGNVIKYVARAGKKDPTKDLQDLEKAAAYLQMAYNVANGLPAVVRDPETREVVWTLFKN